MLIDLAPEILWAFLGVLIVIVVNALLGMWRAWVNKEFDVRMMPDFLRNHVLLDGGALLILAAFSPLHVGIKGLFLLSAAFLGAKYLAKIKDKLAKDEQIDEQIKVNN